MGEDFTDAKGRLWPADLLGVQAQVHPVLGCVVSVGAGWHEMVADFRAELGRRAPGAVLVGADRDMEGGLGLEVAWGDHERDPRLVKAFRSRSFVVCEHCGGPGRLRHDRPVLSVLCNEHEGARDQMGHYRPELAAGRLRRLLRRP